MKNWMRWVKFSTLGQLDMPLDCYYTDPDKHVLLFVKSKTFIKS